MYATFQYIGYIYVYIYIILYYILSVALLAWHGVYILCSALPGSRRSSTGELKPVDICDLQCIVNSMI